MKKSKEIQIEDIDFNTDDIALKTDHTPEIMLLVAKALGARPRLKAHPTDEDRHRSGDDFRLAKAPRVGSLAMGNAPKFSLSDHAKAVSAVLDKLARKGHIKQPLEPPRQSIKGNQKRKNNG